MFKIMYRHREACAGAATIAFNDRFYNENNKQYSPLKLDETKKIMQPYTSHFHTVSLPQEPFFPYQSGCKIPSRKDAPFSPSERKTHAPGLGFI